MGYCPDPSPDMGEYSVEVRNESFYLRGAAAYEGPPRHAIIFYTQGQHQGNRYGTAEILIEDIPKIRAALDQVERILAGNPDKE